MKKACGRLYFLASQATYLIISTLAIASLLGSVEPSTEASLNAKVVHDYIEHKLNPKDPVLVDLHYGFASKVGLEPQMVVVVKHLFKKNCRIVFISTVPSGTKIFEHFQSTIAEIFSNKQYGVDYIFLGYIPCNETTLASLAVSIRKTVEKDNYGISIASYDVMRDVDKAEAFKLAFILSADMEILDQYVRLWAAPYNVPLIFGTLCATASLVESYVAKNFAIGVLAGQKSAAEYEILLSEKESELATTKTRNPTYVSIIVFTIFVNVITLYILHWKSKSKNSLSSALSGAQLYWNNAYLLF
jgi:hypothetical protein